MNKHGEPAQPTLPALSRAARRVFGQAMREELEQAGYDDIPGNGMFVIGVLARSAAPLSRIVSHLGGSKQAAGQLIDTLERRGYLQRSIDADDRRRLQVQLSERGRAAATIIGSVSVRLEADLCARIGADGVAHLRRGLNALTGEVPPIAPEAGGGAVVFAKDAARVADFYVAVCGLVVAGRDEQTVTLQHGSFELLVHAVPAAIAATIRIADPPQRRQSNPIKPVFDVASIAAIRATAVAHGGAIDPPERTWQYQGRAVCDGHDPEGNVFQLRELPAPVDPDFVHSHPPGSLYAAAVLRVSDLDRALAFYRDTLGFAVAFVHGGFYAGIVRDGCHIHLKQASPHARDVADREGGDHIDVCLGVADASALARQWHVAGATLSMPLREMPYGLEFHVRDPDGYVLACVQAVVA